MPLDVSQRRRLGEMVRDILAKAGQGQGDPQQELVEMIQMTQPNLVTMIESYRVQLAARIGTNITDAQVRIDALEAQAAEIEAEQGGGGG